MDQLSQTINNFMNMAALIGAALCGLYLAFGGLKYMGSRGNPSAAESGKAACWDACIGFAVILSARVIAGLINGAVVR